ncbi:hypothetical protein [Corallococcus sp. 4LFB]|uniref:hypothetical protein n=1 Tax=Corallococcus sp. 4LFB TaxID=3383249 RepID=UPI0039771FA3
MGLQPLAHGPLTLHLVVNDVSQFGLSPHVKVMVVVQGRTLDGGVAKDIGAKRLALAEQLPDAKLSEDDEVA